jgi:pimeloyl-ACP methyl ester carboxylesterase
MNQHTVRGGGDIALRVDETGDPILFGHGYTRSRLSRDEQTSSDLADEFRLVATDDRGHGLSDDPTDATRILRSGPTTFRVLSTTSVATSPCSVAGRTAG